MESQFTKKSKQEIMKRNNLFIAAILCVAPLIVGNTAQAQQAGERTIDVLKIVPFPDMPKLKIDGELQTWVDKKEPAPYAGVLLNPEATALIISEHETQKKRGEEALKLQRESDFAVLQLELGKLEVEMSSLKKKSDIKLKAKDDENKRLLSINKDLREDRDDFWGDALLVTGGAGAGVLIGILISVVSGI